MSKKRCPKPMVRKCKKAKNGSVFCGEQSKNVSVKNERCSDDSCSCSR